MSIHEFDDPIVRYDALLYTWADGAESDAITANGYFLNITNNLLVALQHLSRQDEDILLRVVSICLNEKDTDERNAQVAQMGKILSQADRSFLLEKQLFIAARFQQDGQRYELWAMPLLIPRGGNIQNPVSVT
ncbi:uncharacterized protein LY79DRAFT_582932 [Colletotrichum navitas]|uniref:Heterokaryon incompatibility domain-containing protein n=1 Tax=Colletotrichum navitas TaxID=681940 RepID=A0AAD8PQB0_9PEZI|nr:uncharacterized protein LY79DRAFT_582932 [Colletotrichum navitas]KAK1574434.1 hypothetical protein LY79DRAFT_582932 [Colletotrichum navitas]